MHYSQILATLAATGALAAAVPLHARTTGDVEALDKRLLYWDWLSEEKRGELAPSNVEALKKRFLYWDWLSLEKRGEISAEQTEDLGKHICFFYEWSLTNLAKRFV